MNIPQALGALASTTTISALFGGALWHEGVATFLSIMAALLTWWVLGLLIEMLDPEYMSALLRATGVGMVYYRRRPERRHPFFTWGVWRYLDILSLARQCAPYSMKLQRVLKERSHGKVSA